MKHALTKRWIKVMIVVKVMVATVSWQACNVGSA
jgi:hypothetical protein